MRPRDSPARHHQPVGRAEHRQRADTTLKKARPLLRRRAGSRPAAEIRQRQAGSFEFYSAYISGH
jgi:hypothetical protein